MQIFAGQQAFDWNRLPHLRVNKGYKSKKHNNLPTKSSDSGCFVPSKENNFVSRGKNQTSNHSLEVDGSQPKCEAATAVVCPATGQVGGAVLRPPAGVGTPAYSWRRRQSPGHRPRTVSSFDAEYAGSQQGSEPRRVSVYVPAAFLLIRHRTLGARSAPIRQP